MASQQVKRAVVTGAFSYTGASVVSELMRRGWSIHTLTNRRPLDPGSITSAPLRFDLAHLVTELRDADLFVNTYWIRIPYAGQTFHSAVANCRMLFEAAKVAGVARTVHVSVSNACRAPHLGYYHGKHQVEVALRASGLSYAIVRPTLVVGHNDVLTSNIAWMLRIFPFFPLPDGGHYPLQPVTLNDVGKIVADVGEQTSNVEVDAAGPSIITFADYVRLVRRACGLRAWVVDAPWWLSMLGIKMMEPLLGDVVLTWEELLGLQQGLLTSSQPPLGTEPVDRWLIEHGSEVGLRYINDIHRHFGDGAVDVVGLPGR